MSNRCVLPNRRSGETFDVTHGDQRTRFQVTISYFPDQKPAEVFINGAKSGSQFEAVTRDGAIMLSLLLQHGASLETIGHALTREENGTASTIIGAIVDRLNSGS